MRQKIFQSLFGLVFVAGLIYGGWRLIVAFVDAISSATPEVSAAIVGAMATILVGIFAVLFSQAHERKRAAEEAHRLRKVEIYQGFIDMVSRVVGASNSNLAITPPNDKDLLDYLFKFKSDLLLWGSPKVIKAQIEFENAGGRGGITQFLVINNMYLAMREDVGLSNFGLNNYELIKLYLNEEARAQIDGRVGPISQ